MYVWDMQTIAQMQRNFLVPAARALNSSLDFVFYDVNALTSEEKARLLVHANPEGSILIVPPESAVEDITRLTPLEFISSQQQIDTQPIDAIVIAGVGSSALGTAALARNVADKIDRPVAGIVSGFGLADLVSEALGGWFVLGLKNSIRDGFAKTFAELDMKDHVWDEPSYQSLVKEKELHGFDMDRYVYGSPDSAALLLILYHLRTQIKVLVGHSKGNYIIENALEGLISLCSLKKQEVPEDLQIVTLGAIVRFPEQFSKVTQIIGGNDYFGMMNSRFNLPSHRIPEVWHSLNTGLPGHMSVEETLELAEIK